MKNGMVIAVVAVTMLSACGSSNPFKPTSPGIDPGPQQAIAEQRVVSDFRRQGVRVFYTLTGSVEAIEASGYAPVWGRSQNALRESYRVAELEAKRAMTQFIHGEVISTETSVRMISRNLESARDNRTNNFATNRSRPDEIVATDDDLDGDSRGTGGSVNTATRVDALRIANTTRTEIRSNSRGILGGLKLKEAQVIEDGRAVSVVYRWDRSDNAHRQTIRGLMAQ
jgi:hypothetical protein